MRTLASISPGSTAAIARLDGERAFRRRLMELGFLPGATVLVVRRVDVGGLLEVEVRGSRVTLRCGEAAGLWVEESA